MSTEEILSSSSRPAGAGVCAACGSPLAEDQRYCLECGERRPAASEFLRAGPPGSRSAPAGSQTPPVPPVPPLAAAPQRPNQWLTVLAGIGVLLLAMGVGVLIGRAGGSSGKPAPAQVITFAGAPSAGSGESSETAGETVKEDWPKNTKGFTVALQTLPESATASSVAQAKSAASGKGATAVGVLSESEHSSFSGSGYVIYSGVYHTKAEAQAALGKLKGKFPSAKVVEVANGESESSGAGSKGGGSLSKPAPPTTLKKLKKAKGGKGYEEQSIKLPNVIETG